MSKKRNKYFLREKALIRLQQEDRKNTDAMRNQGWIELETPIHHGYNAEWVLRSDYARREDAHVYQEALDACKEKVWCRTPDFRYKNYKTKKWEIYKPKLNKINKEKYEALSASAKKFFFESIDTKKHWKYGYTDKEYRCTLSYELVVLVSKSFITHRREHDNVLYQIDAEINKLMYNISPNPWGYRNGNPRWYRKHELKKEKLQEERKIVDVKKAYTAKGDWKSKNDLLDIG